MTLVPATDPGTRVAATVAAIRERTPLMPRLAVVLGSGLGAALAPPADAVVLATGELPHWPRSTVSGHAGRLTLGRWHGLPVALLSGRVHRYEGYPLDVVTHPVRVLRALGAGTMIFTNAAGAIHHEFLPGDLVLASDHINLIGKHGLFTPREIDERRAGRRIAHAHSPRLAALLLDAARAAGVPLRRGTLLGFHGPSYETAAEIRMAAKMGADVVCMSTVHEVTLAAELGAECAAISCVTNLATGRAGVPLSHAEVEENARHGAASLGLLLDRLVRTLEGDAGERPRA